MRLAAPIPLILALCASPAVQGTPVEAPHPVYAFLRRLEVKGILDRPFLGSLPLPQSRVLDLLRGAALDSARLGAWERRELARYRAEFDPDLRHLASRLEYADSGRLLSGRVEYFAGGYLRDSLPRDEAYAYTALTPKVEGRFTGNLGFVSEATVGAEISRDGRYFMNYDPQRGLPYNTRVRTAGRLDDGITFDSFRTVVSWGGNGYGIDAGNDWNQWGPGIWQHPTFGPRPWFWVQDSLPADDSSRFAGSYLPGSSRHGYRRPGEGPPPTQLRLDIAWRRLKYVKFIAEKTGLSAHARAFLVAHRLEARPTRNLLVGVHEMVAFAGRSFEATYGIPFVPLKFAEHQVGDKDNIGIGFDADYRLPRGMRVYSELFFDDVIAPQDMFDDYWGNKFAWVVGWEAFDLPLPASGLQVEYARVEPWLFGHHALNNQMQHYGSLLGSALPPNSHAAWARWSQALPRGLEAEIEYAFLQRQTRARGSSIFDVHEDLRDGKGKDFLGEDPETRNGLRASLAARYRRHLLAKVSLGYLRVDSWKSAPGSSLSGPLASAEIVLAY